MLANAEMEITLSKQVFSGKEIGKHRVRQTGVQNGHSRDRACYLHQTVMLAVVFLETTPQLNIAPGLLWSNVKFVKGKGVRGVVEGKSFSSPVLAYFISHFIFADCSWLSTKSIPSRNNEPIKQC